MRVRRQPRITFWLSTMGFVLTSMVPLISASAQDPPPESTEATYRIHGMVCQGCADQVQEVIAGLEGVRSARVSFSEGRADVVWEGEARDAALIEAVREAGYQARRVEEPAGSG